MLFDLSPLPLQPFLTDLTSQFSATADASGVHLHCDIAPGVPSAVIANETRLKQVLSNILSNAIKFSNPGGEVHLRVEPNSEACDDALFSVEDSGLGIRLEDQTKIFEPYQRSHEGLARQGTGLGLPIAQGLLEKMGTTLNLDSELGKGSRFHFVLASAAGLPPARVNSTEDKPNTLQGKSVLVAEDNAQAAVVVLGMLGAMGCTVWHARDGEEAISLYKEFNPDCVLMDIQMPKINGVEVTRAIREIEKSNGKKEVFILAVTGELNQEAVTETVGFNGLLQKPFSPSDLLTAISRGL
jgi:CheY-like chemotaxis protein